MEDKIKILLDTDIGDDIDDAFALQYALNHPKIDLLGVTTVYKNAYQRSCIAKKILAENDRGDVPVYVGEDNPIKEPLKPFLYEKTGENGKTDLLSWKDEYSAYRAESGSAVDFILDTIEKNPYEIVLVGIGPMTNVAKAFLKAPDTMKKLRRVVLMCGNVAPVYEWNIMCDPEAASVVLGSGLEITCVGSNCTEQCFFDLKELLEYLSVCGKALGFIHSMMKEWITYNMRPPIMHDGLALSEAVNNFVRYKKCKVEVPLHDERRGMIICTECADGNIAMSCDFDRAGFMAHFKKIYSEV